MKKDYKFSIGTIVTLKTHPLLYNLEIKGDGKLIPPFMIVKEIFIEKENKITHSEEFGKQIADKIKYNCVFFDDNKTTFKEVLLYETMLKKFTSIYIARKDGKIKDDQENYESLIQETKKYKKPKYEYGKILFFKTKKFEILKKRTSLKILNTVSEPNDKDGDGNKEIRTVQYVVNYSSPEFILCSVKRNELKNDYYPDGKIKRKVSKTLFKVKWFNSSQMKFSDIYLPRNCFTDKQPFKSEVKYNSKKKGK